MSPSGVRYYWSVQSSRKGVFSLIFCTCSSLISADSKRIHEFIIDRDWMMDACLHALHRLFLPIRQRFLFFSGLLPYTRGIVSQSTRPLTPPQPHPPHNIKAMLSEFWLIPPNFTGHESYYITITKLKRFRCYVLRLVSSTDIYSWCMWLVRFIFRLMVKIIHSHLSNKFLAKTMTLCVVEWIHDTRLAHTNTQ